MARPSRAKVKVPKQKAASAFDPAFAAEMAEASRQRHEAHIGDFPARWAERMKRPVTTKRPAGWEPTVRR